MSKRSAGIIPYRINNDGIIEILLVHPGGPFWKNKDVNSWSIAKGEYDDNEDPLIAAKREFTEETGNILPEKMFIKLDPVKVSSGKIISAWVIEADFDKAFIGSNFFELEWPPKSGKIQFFAEVDKADWFTLEDAYNKIHKGQIPIVRQLEKLLL